MSNITSFETLTLDKIVREIDRTERLCGCLPANDRTRALDYIEDLKKEKDRRRKASGC